MNSTKQTVIGTGSKNREDVLRYYDTCWLNRFQEGHNPKSFAMHFGIFDREGMDNDEAKLETNRFISRQLKLDASERGTVVDLGCGIGGTCLFLAKNFPLLDVTGVNLSLSQLAFAQQLMNENGVASRVTLREDDYCNTGLEGATATHAYAVESLWHATDKGALFAEANRLLKLGGHFLVIDYFQLRPTESAEEEAMLRTFNIGWGAYEPGTGPIAAHAYDHEQDMRSIGFSEVRTESLLASVMPGIVNSYHKALRHLEGSLTDDLKRHYEACVALKLLADNGLVGYGMVKAVK
jgi:tocopherol O-methyltransferase